MSITGHVLDERQQPASNVPVRIFGPDGHSEASTDENGTYRFSGDPSGLYAVIVEDAECSITASTRMEHKWEGVTSIVTERVTIEGVVVDSDSGHPMPEFECAEVWDTEQFRTGHAPSRHSYPATRVEDAKGRFTIPIYKPRLPAVAFRAPGYQPYLVRFANDQTGAQIGGMVVPLVPYMVVNGTVVDAKGKPIKGATIALGAMTPLSHDPDAQGLAKSDANGHVRFEIARDSAQTLVAHHPEFAPSAVRIEPGTMGTPTLRIVLTPGGRIEGTVTRDGVLVPDALVLVKSAEFIWKSTHTDARGYYLFKNVSPGKAMILVGAASEHGAVADGLTTVVDIGLWNR